MKKKPCALLLAALFIGSALQAQDVAKPVLRTWKDSTGQFSIQATFVRVNGDQVVLQGTDKKEISLPLAKLSVADQQYVKARPTPPQHDKDAIAKVLIKFVGADDLPTRLTCVVNPEEVRTYMATYYRKYFLELKMGLLAPIVLDFITIKGAAGDTVDAVARFKDSSTFPYRFVKTENGYLIDWMHGRREELIARNIIASEVKARAWDLVLPGSAVDSSLKKTRRTDFLKGEATTTGATLPARCKDSMIKNEYVRAIRRTPGGRVEEELSIEIEVLVCKTDKFAIQEMNIRRQSAFGNPSSSFHCKKIAIPAIGDQSFCKKWGSFAPDVVVRKGHVVVTVSCTYDYVLKNRTANSSITLEQSITAALKQVTAIK